MGTQKSGIEQFPSARFTLAAIISLAFFGAYGTTYAQDTDGVGQNNRHSIRSLELDGEQAQLRISNPGRIARPVCASTLNLSAHPR